MRCVLTIKGRVQDTGYRSFIEERARDRRLKGYVFNKRDGTVNVVCEGTPDKIDDFVDAINLHEEDAVFVEDILKDELLDINYPMPDTFGQVRTDTKEDTNRKLDKGFDAIKAVEEAVKTVKEDTGAIRNDTFAIKNDTSVIRNDTSVMVSILEKHTKLLERIADK